jgi:hypothetical protein
MTLTTRFMHVRVLLSDGTTHGLAPEQPIVIHHQTQPMRGFLQAPCQRCHAEVTTQAVMMVDFVDNANGADPDPDVYFHAPHYRVCHVCRQMSTVQIHLALRRRPRAEYGELLWTRSKEYGPVQWTDSTENVYYRDWDSGDPADKSPECIRDPSLPPFAIGTRLRFIGPARGQHRNIPPGACLQVLETRLGRRGSGKQVPDPSKHHIDWGPPITIADVTVDGYSLAESSTGHRAYIRDCDRADWAVLG